MLALVNDTMNGYAIPYLSLPTAFRMEKAQKPYVRNYVPSYISMPFVCPCGSGRWWWWQWQRWNGCCIFCWYYYKKVWNSLLTHINNVHRHRVKERSRTECRNPRQSDSFFCTHSVFISLLFFFSFSSLLLFLLFVFMVVVVVVVVLYHSPVCHIVFTLCQCLHPLTEHSPSHNIYSVSSALFGYTESRK